MLEHIDDIRACCARSANAAPGACLVIWVPAFQFLYSPFDRKLGHVRRYRKNEAERDVRLAGYEWSTLAT